MSQADRGPLMFDLAVTLLALSTVTVVLRCYVRIFMLKTFRGEDYFALATQVRAAGLTVHTSHGLMLTDRDQACYGLYCAAVIYSCMHGGGKHIGDVLPSDIPLALKVSNSKPEPQFPGLGTNTSSRRDGLANLPSS